MVAIGGGSTIGLGKAIAYRNDAPQIVVATTYAGSEVTPILGQTENGQKTTVRGPGILPEVVIYDPELTLGLPVNISVSSGLNAMAHAVEGLYAQDRNPISSMMAVEGLRALKQALPQIVNAPGDIEPRSEALYGSWLCGTVLGAVGMALHHKLCHTLGGSFDLPHAETHAVILPHSAAYNAEAAADALEPATDLFGGSLGGGLYDFAASIGAPLALRDLGMKEADLDPAAELAAQNPLLEPAPDRTGSDPGFVGERLGGRAAALTLWRMATCPNISAKRDPRRPSTRGWGGTLIRVWPKSWRRLSGTCMPLPRISAWPRRNGSWPSAF